MKHSITICYPYYPFAINLGIVTDSYSKDDKARAKSDIMNHWRNFQEMHPDSDDEFINYLVDHGYDRIDDGLNHITLQG